MLRFLQPKKFVALTCKAASVVKIIQELFS